jgi:transcriptional regulator with XRE-family HTH domain
LASRGAFRPGARKIFISVKFFLSQVKNMVIILEKIRRMLISPIEFGSATKGRSIFMENLGERIRDERRKRNLTLEQLSQKTELSKSFLSQVERGVAQPSVSSLKRIAREFGMSVVELFTNGINAQNRVGSIPTIFNNGPRYVEDFQVVRANWRKTLTLPGSKVSYDLLTPDLNRQLEVMYMRIEPGEHSGEEPMIDLPGEKFGLVLQGGLEVRVRGEVHQLKAGDSVYFPAHFPHAWRGMGKDSIEVIWVLTPPRF